MKDRSGRLVFVLFGLKRECYFADSKSDEEKIRAFVRMYRRQDMNFSPFSCPIFLGHPSITASALSRDTNGFASQERSQGRFGGVCRTVHRRPLTPRMARQNSHATKPTGLRLEQDLFVRSRPRLAFESCGGR